MVLTLSAMNDVIALKFHILAERDNWIGSIGMFVLPPFIYFHRYRWVWVLQRSDRCRPSSTASKTGIIQTPPHGATSN